MTLRKYGLCGPFLSEKHIYLSPEFSGFFQKYSFARKYKNEHLDTSGQNTENVELPGKTVIESVQLNEYNRGSSVV